MFLGFRILDTMLNQNSFIAGQLIKRQKIEILESFCILTFYPTVLISTWKVDQKSFKSYNNNSTFCPFIGIRTWSVD